MIWRVPRPNIFLAKETRSFLWIAIDPLNIIYGIQKPLRKFSKLLGKTMSEFWGFVSPWMEEAESNLRRTNSEQNLHTCAESWLTQMHDQFISRRHTLGLAPIIPPLMQIPIPSMPVSEVAAPPPPPPLKCESIINIQSSFYLRKTISAGNIPKPSFDEMAPILKVLSKRSWQDLPIKKENHSKRNFEFTVMSYNVLAQKLLNEHPYLYKNNKLSDLDWETRWRNLFNEIRTLRPDILCLQEVQDSHVSGYYGQLEILGYKSLYKKRTGLRCDGCAIYFKPDRLSLVEYETVEFFQPGIPVLNRDNIAIIAKFSPRHSPKYHFLVATTHLLYNPKRQDVRMAQTQLLLTELERLSYHPSPKGKEWYWPIIITGDFNSTPDSAVYEFITKGTLKYDHLAARKLDQPESPRHGNVLVPHHLQVTDKCQHAALVQERSKKKKISRTEEAALIRLVNSEKKEAKVITEIIRNPKLFSSGTLNHLFALKSVYSHGDRDNPEGTTFQGEWVTVDYIFFSKGKRRGEHAKNRKLKLLSYYSLPLKSDLGSIHIPNCLMGSDHLSLVAKFSLKI